MEPDIDYFGILNGAVSVAPIDVNGGVAAPVIVPVTNSIPQGYQNVETPDYRLNKGSMSYVSRHFESLNKDLPWKYRPRPDTQTDVRKARQDAEFRQACLNLYETISSQEPPEEMQNLKIFTEKDDILRSIERNQVTLILGRTGCGKSSQVPQFILDDHVDRNKPCRIFVTQPRRVAAMSVAEFVAKTRGWELGQIVGYQVGGDKDSMSDEVLIRYVTPGVFLRQVMGFKTKEAKQMTHLIIDEIHERTAEMDTLLILVRRMLVLDPELRVVLMSATFDDGLYRQYFTRPEFNRYPGDVCVPAVRIKMEQFEVKEHWLDHLMEPSEPMSQTIMKLHGGHLDPVSLDEPRLVPWVVDVAVDLIKKHSLSNEVERRMLPSAREKGSILVFLPGYAEIEDLMERLTALNPILNKWQLIPLHSRLRSSAERKIFEPAEPGHRKIILSTNIAESSITIKDVRYIIDFALTKRNVVDKDTNLSFLRLEWCSQAEIKQRTGRAGRVQEGKIFHLIRKDFYDKLDKDPPPEITRAPLTRLVLSAKLSRILGGSQKYLQPKEIFAEALTPPDEQDIDLAILSLKELGGLSLSRDGSFGGHVDPHDGQVTQLGRVMNALPIDPHLSRLVMLGDVLGVPEEVVALASVLSFENVFVNTLGGDLRRYYAALCWSGGSFSDPVGLLRAYEAYKNSEDRKAFCRANQLDPKVMAEVLLKEDDLTEILRREMGVDVDAKVENEWLPAGDRDLALKISLFGAFYPNYFVSNQRTEREIWREAGSDADALNSVYLKSLPMDASKIYADQIRKALEEISDDFSLKFRDSKCFVTFGHNGRPASQDFLLPEDDDKRLRRVSIVNTSVYLALRNWRGKRAFSIRVFDGRTGDSKRPKLDPECSMDDSAVPMFGDELPFKNLTRVRRTFQTRVGRDFVPQSFDVEVTFVEDPSSFWARCRDGGVDEVQRRLNEPQTIGRMRPMLKARIRPGVHVLAPSTADAADPGNPEYHRAVICKVGTDAGRRTALVRLVDSGKQERVLCESLKGYTKEVHNLLKGPGERLAFHCSLAETFPYAMTGYEQTYSQAAIDEFKRLVEVREESEDRRILAKIYSVVHNEARVFLYTEDNDYSVTIQRMLVDRNLASFVEEGAESRRDYAEFRSVLISTEESDRVLQPSAGGCGDDGDGDGSAIDAPVSGLEVGDENEFVPGTSVLKLTGPLSALEVQFAAMSYKQKERRVGVSSDSVNAVALDTFCGRGSPQMLVAGRVSLGATTEKLYAHYTTATNWKPGKPLLLSTLFAPAVEFRVDDSGTRIVGVLCGLRYTMDQQKRPVAVFPDHDMEIDSDVELAQDDVARLNAIRCEFNELMTKLDEMEAGALGKRNKARCRLMCMIKEHLDTPRLRLNAWKGPEVRCSHNPNHWRQLKRLGLKEAVPANFPTAAEGEAPFAFGPLMAPSLRDPDQLDQEDNPVDDQPDRKLADFLMNLAFLKKRAHLVGGEYNAPAAGEMVIHCAFCEDMAVASRDVGAHLRSDEHLQREAWILRGLVARVEELKSSDRRYRGVDLDALTGYEKEIRKMADAV